MEIPYQTSGIETPDFLSIQTKLQQPKVTSNDALSLQNSKTISLNDAQKISMCLKTYCDALDAVNEALEMLLKTRTELKSMLLVQNVLLENRLETTNSIEQTATCSSDIIIPTEVKCPVCFEIYSKKIFQCVNGHCICSNCSYNVNMCPECRVPYSGNNYRLVRNRALESLMATSLKVDCPNLPYGCNERLKCKEIQIHLRSCRHQKKSDELLKTEKEVEILKEEIRAYEKEVEKLNKKVGETREQWTLLSSQQENRLIVIQAKSEHEVLKKEMQKCNLSIKLKSLIYFNQ